MLTPWAWQQEILDSPMTNKVVMGERLVGKSTLTYFAAQRALLEGKKVLWVVPSYHMMQDAYRVFLNHIANTPHPLPRFDAFAERRRIYYPSGGEVVLASAVQPDLLRGRVAECIIMDNADIFSREAWVALSQQKTDYLVVMQAANYAAIAFQVYLEGLHNADSQSWYISAERVVAHFPFAEAPSPWVFTNAPNCVTHESPRRSDEKVVMGVDFGDRHDRGAVVVMGTMSHYVYRAVRLGRGLSWQRQKEALKGLARKWQAHLILVTSVNGTMIETLQAEGFPINPYSITAQTKTQLLSSLQVAISEGKLSLPNDAELVRELVNYRGGVSAEGEWKSAAEAGNDNLIKALALALHASRYPKVRVVYYA